MYDHHIDKRIYWVPHEGERYPSSTKKITAQFSDTGGYCLSLFSLSSFPPLRGTIQPTYYLLVTPVAAGVFSAGYVSCSGTKTSASYPGAAAAADCLATASSVAICT